MNKPGKNSRIGIIGMGSMGMGLLYQANITPGVDCVAISDIRIERCIEAAKRFSLAYEVAASEDAMGDAIGRGITAICEDGLWVSRCEQLDAVIEATSAIGPAGRHAVVALEQGKQVILMNSEIDLIFGPMLARVARKNKVVCTSCDGDQHGVLKHLVDDIHLWGFDLVMAGNIKGFLNRYADPTTIIAEADKRNLDYRMCVSYTDGTKLNIEMAIIANACGLSTKVPGMYGPEAQHVGDVFQLYDFDVLWADRRPFVDYILGAEPGGGVFAIGYCDDPYQKEMLMYYKMGKGPYYLFYRPYHLCHIEAMDTVLKAVNERRSFLQPEHGFRTNVYAYAKIDLLKGDCLDGIGGYKCYGKIENCNENETASGLPICLSEGVTLNRAVAKDEKILLDDIIYNPRRPDFAMYTDALEDSEIMSRTLKLP